MAFASYLGSGGITQWGNTSPASVPLGAGWSAGDLAYLIVHATHSTVPTITPSAGWSSIGKVGEAGNTLEVFRRILQAGDSSPTVTVDPNNSSTGARAAIVRFGSAVSPYENGLVTSLLSAATTQTIPDFTGTLTDLLGVAIVAGPQNLTVATWTVLTERFDGGQGGGAGGHIAVGDAQFALSGLHDMGTVDFSSSAVGAAFVFGIPSSTSSTGGVSATPGTAALSFTGYAPSTSIAPALADSVLINGTEYEILEEPPLTITDIVDQPSTASFCVKDVFGVHRFDRHQRVLIYDENGARAFAGYIQAVDETRLNQAGAMKHKIVCMDNHWKAKKRKVAASYVNTQLEAIVADLVGTYLEPDGVTEASAEIDDGPLVGEAVFAYRPLPEIFDKLAELMNAWWRIDHDDIFHMKVRGTETAPWTLTGIDIIGTPKYTRSNPQYRNAQYLRGPKNQTVTQNFTATGDGESREWAMGFPLAKVPTVKVNAVAKTVDLKFKAGDHTADFYWQQGDETIVQDSNGTVLTGSDTLTVDYIGEFPVIIYVEDEAEQVMQAAIEGGGPGIIENVADEVGLTDRTAAIQKAGAMLMKYGVDGEVLSFRTRRSGLAPGQSLTVYLPAHALDNDDMLITEVRKTRRRSPEGSMGFIYYCDVTAVIGPVSESWQKFFARIVQPASFIEALSLGEVGSLTIVHAESEEIGMDESVVFTATACNYPATDEYPSLTRWPC